MELCVVMLVVSFIYICVRLYNITFVQVHPADAMSRVRSYEMQKGGK